MSKKEYRVLLVPSGSAMAVAANHALRRYKGFKIIGADSNKLAAGMYLCDEGYTVPKFKDKNFFPAIKKIAKKEKIDVIFPCLDPVLYDFSKRKREFEEIGSKVIVSDPESISICRDKWKTMKKLKDKIPLPESCIKKEDVKSYPVFIKPRDGSGSKHIYKINSKEELDALYDKVPKPIIQEFLAGKEYSIDCLCDKDGKLLACVPQERIDSRSGVATQGKIVKNKKLREIAEKISETIKFSGPFFFQTIEDDKGVPKLTEINPRIAGIMSLSSNSGVNIHALAVKIFMGEEVSIPKINYDIYMTRYLSDIFLKDEDLKKDI